MVMHFFVLWAGFRQALVTEPTSTHSHGREAARLHSLLQGFFNLLQPQHTQEDSQWGKTTLVLNVREKVHGLVKPLLPQDDTRQGINVPLI